MIVYKVLPMVNPQKPKEPKKYYARAVSRNQDTLKSIAAKMAKDCTPNEEDCLVVIDGIMTQVINGLMEGKIVQIDRFGTFRLTIVNQNNPTAEEYVEALKNGKAGFTAASIKGVNIIFTPDPDLKRSISEAPVGKFLEQGETDSLTQLLEANGIDTSKPATGGGGSQGGDTQGGKDGGDEFDPDDI